jgi:site-specific DNA-methyltransferase (adenine-specific)
MKNREWNPLTVFHFHTGGQSMPQPFHIEKVYPLFYSAIQLIQTEKNTTHIIALHDFIAYLMENHTLSLSELGMKKMKHYQDEIAQFELTKDERIELFEFLLLQLWKSGELPPPTPQAIGMIAGILLSNIEHRDAISILDPAMNTGAFLMSVLKMYNHPVHAYGISIDSDQEMVAAIYAKFIQQPLHLVKNTHDLPKIDIIISEVSDDKYVLDTIDEYIEMGEDGSWMLFIIPDLFSDENDADRIVHRIQSKACIYSVIQFPDHFFQNKEDARQLLLLQKKGTLGRKPKQIFLLSLNDVKPQDVAKELVYQLHEWAESEFTKKN